MKLLDRSTHYYPSSPSTAFLALGKGVLSSLVKGADPSRGRGRVCMSFPQFPRTFLCHDFFKHVSQVTNGNLQAS